MKRGSKERKNSSGNKVIGIDLGGTNFRVALVSFEGRRPEVIKYIKKRTPKNKAALLRDLEKFVRWYIETDKNKEIQGIGVSFAGPVENGIVKNPPNIPLKNFDLKKYLKKKFKKQVEIENDANCFAIAEINYGCKKKNFIIATLGTGIGGGIIINGELYKGKGSAGEFGHIIVDKGKDFEDLTAGKRQKNLTKKVFGKALTINELMKINNSKSKKVLNEICEYLGQGFGTLINVFDPEIVVLGGGVKETGKKFLRMVQKKTNKYTMFLRKTTLMWTNLEHPGVVGAATLIKKR